MHAAADVAIVGMSTLLPRANRLAEFWENVLGKVDAITEIPAHRWDWRLYFDPDRRAPDKIYSKWGGFLDELCFDPTRYGMPPKSVTACEPRVEQVPYISSPARRPSCKSAVPTPPDAP